MSDSVKGTSKLFEVGGKAEFVWFGMVGRGFVSLVV